MELMRAMLYWRKAASARVVSGMEALVIGLCSGRLRRCSAWAVASISRQLALRHHDNYDQQIRLMMMVMMVMVFKGSEEVRTEEINKKKSFCSAIFSAMRSNSDSSSCTSGSSFSTIAVVVDFADGGGGGGGGSPLFVSSPTIARRRSSRSSREWVLLQQITESNFELSIGSAGSTCWASVGSSGHQALKDGG
ncbi:hypothetical protein TYRP_009236 [Tyrophagus putrescentiae]|nr:hypothetical protein TYRP_009236 [Tyrophagus putrescentiae]